MPLFRKNPPEYIAAIDLGSNSFHMIVARNVDGQFHIQDRIRDSVRLAAGLDKKKQLTDKAKTRALECLEIFGQRLRDMPPGSVRAVGTNTLRSARNSAEFITEAEKKLGHPINIISGVEEARLIYLGVAHSLAQDELQRLVVDIGGGSTELIIGESFTPKHLESLYMGCVSMSRDFFPDGEITAKGIKKAEIAARVELEPIERRYRKIGWDDVVGASGTIRAIDGIVTSQGWSDDGITKKSLQKLISSFSEFNHVSELTTLGVNEDRAEVLPGGAIVLLAVFKALKIDHMHVSDGALREGLLHELMGQLHHEDVRSHSIEAMAKRYHVDMEHAQRIGQTACILLTQVSDNWQLDEESLQDWLNWAAQLHEIGLDIAHSSYHKHGAYIIENADMAGLSRQEQLLLSLLVRSHRRRFSEKLFDALSSGWAKTAIKLALLLRIAVLLNRSRDDVPLPDIQLRTKKKSLELQFPDNWLNNHALTVADLEQEADWLKDSDYSLSYR